MTDRDLHNDSGDLQSPARRRRAGAGDIARVAENEATTEWPEGAESSYSAAALSKGRTTARRDNDDAPFEVHIEFVQLDGPEGQALRRRQAEIMRKVLRWLADHPDPDSP